MRVDTAPSDSADSNDLVRPEGLEPPAFRFEACRSIQLSYGRTEAESAILSRLPLGPAPRGRPRAATDSAQRYGRIGFCLGAIFRADHPRSSSSGR
jgi:hypothetical protein